MVYIFKKDMNNRLPLIQHGYSVFLNYRISKKKKKRKTKMLSFLWHMISLAVIKSMFFIKKQSAILQLPLMVFTLICFQPSEEAWITPPWI